ncbi:MAG: PKD domain-containing protein [Ferruginibacter sp.]
MKRIITLLLLLAAGIGFRAQAQTTPVCNADFSFSYVTSNTVKFTPVLIGDSINTMHYWKFGNGNVANIPLPTYTYPAPGTYNVTHIMVRTGTAGTVTCMDSVTKQVVIQSVPCNLQASFSSVPDSLNFLKIYFLNTSVNAALTDSVRWNFGDGTIINGLMSDPAMANPVHIYANAGTYNVCLRVKRNSNTTSAPCVGEICKTVVVAAPCNLQAYFTAQPDTAHPLRIKFTNMSPGVALSDSIRWTFGDGTSISGLQSDPNVANPTHNYAQAGVYTVCIRIKRNITTAGTTPCVREYCKTVVVASPCNFQVAFIMHRDSLVPRKVIFTNMTIVPSATATATWSFGDGTAASSWNAVHEYAQPGTYIVCLTVSIAPNCTKTSCDTIIIPTPAPDCRNLSKFTFEKVVGDNQKYKFTPDFISAATQYTWTFGDGTGSHDPVAVHRYAQAGVYIVCLTAWNGPNCASTTCKEVRVLPQLNCDSIHVSYTWQKDPFVPNKLYFYANANFPILDQTWTITRLSPATTPPVILHQNNPSYVFGDTGLYRVCLKAVTLGGCVKEYCSVIRIENVSNACLLQAYPSPATNLINVAVTLTQPEMIHAYVYSSSNVLVREKHVQGVSGSNVVTINVDGLPAGLYTIKLIYGNKTCYARFNKL